jgi:hypothetical protein
LCGEGGKRVTILDDEGVPPKAEERGIYSGNSSASPPPSLFTMGREWIRSIGRMRRNWREISKRMRIKCERLI